MTKTVKAIMDQKTRKLNSIKKLFNNILYSLGKSIFYMTFYFVENTFTTQTLQHIKYIHQLNT